MSVLRNHEKRVLDLLAPSVLSLQQIEEVAREGIFVSYKYSGCGYFLTLAHPSLPKERMVCSNPAVMGHADGRECGVILFIEVGELMIECHTWGAIDVPEGFREMDMRVEVATNVIRNGDN